MQHPFDRALALEATGPNRWRARTSADYRNMVGPFGGITAAVVMRALMDHPERLGDPVAMTLNYAGPIADGDYDVEIAPLRTNRSSQHWTVRLVQDGQDQPALSATAVTGLRREAWSDVELPRPRVPAFEALPRADFPIAGATWPDRYDMRVARGPLVLDAAATPNADSLTELWMRDSPPRPLDFPSLAAFCDGFFPRVYLRRPRFVPAGTVSMTAYFHVDAARLAAQGDAPVLGVARGQAFASGFFDQSAQVWGQGGELLATTHQIVYYKE